VAHELAYFGIPSIACARHPHHSFDFCRTAHSTEQYAQYLLSPETLPVPKEEMRRQALAFYFMHNQYGDPESLVLRRSYNEFWKACMSEDTPEETLALRFRELRNLPAFKAAVEKLL
jgi:hypothetical protein